MTFALYADEKMTVRAGDAVADGRRLGVSFDLAAAVAYRDFVFYFGSPDASLKLQTSQNTGVDNIVISPVDALPDRTGNTPYKTGDAVEPANGGGLIYQCTTAGSSGGTAPSWVKVVGGNTADGTVVWRCMGARYKPEDIKLALSASGLDSAVGGADLSLGPTLNGGAAVAVYVRIMRSVNAKYRLPETAQIGLDLNDCVESGI